MDVPYPVKKLSEEDKAKLKKISSVNFNGAEFIQAGAKGYFLYEDFLEHAADIYNMQLRPTDVFVASYPRSECFIGLSLSATGTTWTQELVWLLANDLDFDKAKSTLQYIRFPYIEACMYYRTMKRVHPNEDIAFGRVVPAELSEMADPRFIKTHLPMSLLPEKILDTTKVVYVARDPRDVVVSCYHFYTSLSFMGITCDFKEFFDIFINNLDLYSPFWDHIEEAWALRDHPNMLFLFYEDLSKDLKSCARRVAKFLNKQYSEEQLDTLCEHLRFDNFQKNPAVRVDDEVVVKNPNKFIRKGQSGGWRSALDGETRARACAWVRDNMRARGLRLPWSEE